jgi:NAD(P)-dependent dehydrogenase (short-subunit alcohol dehydrogenase family)
MKIYLYVMARIFITGSADGLGHLAAKHLVHDGHSVVLHARNEKRAGEALVKVPGAEHALAADLGIPEEVKRLALEANSMGTFDAVIHNAGVYQVAGNIIFRVNTLAPYILTCMMNKPERLIYLSSGLHMQGNARLAGFDRESVNYSDSKLHMVLLAKLLSRRWHGVYANAVDPGWVPTKMGGAGAPGSLEKGIETQSWLAISNDREAMVSGRYFYHKKEKHHHPQADDTDVQDRFLELCEKVTGVKLEE